MSVAEDTAVNGTRGLLPSSSYSQGMRTLSFSMMADIKVAPHQPWLGTGGQRVITVCLVFTGWPNKYLSADFLLLSEETTLKLRFEV